MAWLPELIIEGTERPVVQVIAEASGEILYTIRVRGNRFQPHVYFAGLVHGEGRTRPAGWRLGSPA